MQRYCLAKAGVCSIHIRESAAKPMISNSGSPLPVISYAMSTSPARVVSMAATLQACERARHTRPCAREGRSIAEPVPVRERAVDVHGFGAVVGRVDDEAGLKVLAVNA